MRTLEEIEAEARRLCGDEFEVVRPTERALWIEHRKNAAVFRAEGFQRFDFGPSDREMDGYAEWWDICRKLDSYIRGET